MERAYVRFRKSFSSARDALLWIESYLREFPTQQWETSVEKRADLDEGKLAVDVSRLCVAKN